MKLHFSYFIFKFIYLFVECIYSYRVTVNAKLILNTVNVLFPKWISVILFIAEIRMVLWKATQVYVKYESVYSICITALTSMFVVPNSHPSPFCPIFVFMKRDTRSLPNLMTFEMRLLPLTGSYYSILIAKSLLFRLMKEDSISSAE